MIAPPCDGPDDSGMWPTMNKSQRRNADAFLSLAAGRGILLENEGGAGADTRVAIANVTNTPMFSNQISSRVAPALLRNSFLYELVRDSPVSIIEYWLIMGYPHPSLAHQGLDTDMFGNGHPVAQSLYDESFTIKEQKCLLGNGMHVAQIGCFQLYRLCTTVTNVDD